VVTIVVVVVVVLLGLASLGGLVLYSQAHDVNPSDVGVALDEQGRPVLIAVQCPGHTIAQATIERAGTSEVVWSAERSTGPGVNELALVGDIPGYKVTGEVTAPDALFEVAQVRNERGEGVGTAQIEFRLSDLQRNDVIVGLQRLDGPPRYVSRAEFLTPPTRC
jgi:hypothetical protein